MKLKKDDRVVVLGGKDKGRTGKIEKVLPRQAKVLIAGLNLFKKHVRPQGERQPGGVVEIAKPLPAAGSPWFALSVASGRGWVIELTKLTELIAIPS